MITARLLQGGGALRWTLLVVGHHADDMATGLRHGHHSFLFTAESLLEYFRSAYVARNMIISAAGNLGDGPLVVVIGSEGKGLSRLVAETCDQLVSIPMASSLESLNAGVAASIALYSVAQARK